MTEKITNLFIVEDKRPNEVIQIHDLLNNGELSETIRIHQK